jgi:hypothetical protein
MPVAIRGRVDEHQKPLIAFVVEPIVTAILRAEIDGRLFRWRVAAEDIVEFGVIVAREKHVMTTERESIGLRDHAPGHGR